MKEFRRKVITQWAVSHHPKTGERLQLSLVHTHYRLELVEGFYAPRDRDDPRGWDWQQWEWVEVAEWRERVTGADISFVNLTHSMVEDIDHAHAKRVGGLRAKLREHFEAREREAARLENGDVQHEVDKALAEWLVLRK